MPIGQISRQHLVRMFIALFLAIQLAIPALGLFGPRPGRFSWQMYSGVQTPANFKTVHQDGSVRDISAADYLVQPRLEMNLLQWLPEHVCSVDETVTAFRIEHLRAPEEDFACPR